MVKNGIMTVSEGANMPTDPRHSYLPGTQGAACSGKAANAGGAASPGLKCARTACAFTDSWEVTAASRVLRRASTNSASPTAKRRLLHLSGANIAGFKKVVDSMPIRDSSERWRKYERGADSVRPLITDDIHPCGAVLKATLQRFHRLMAQRPNENKRSE